MVFEVEEKNREIIWIVRVCSKKLKEKSIRRGRFRK